MTVAMFGGACVGALIGEIAFAIYERSYWRRGVVYRVWMRRTTKRPKLPRFVCSICGQGHRLPVVCCDILSNTLEEET